MAVERAELLAAFQVPPCDAIPRYMREPLIRYLVDHEPVGGFLMAVLSNDLRRAYRHADDTNRPLLSAYAAFLYWHAPAGAWGSADAVRAWVNGKESRHDDPR